MIRACFRVGQTGVRFENQRQIGACTHGLKNRRDLLRTKGAIHAQRIHAQRVQRHRRRIRTAAEERPAGSLERHRGKHRQIGTLLGRQDARAELVQIGKRFKKNALCARRRARANHLRIQRVGLVKFERPQRLKQFADGADVEQNLRIRSRAGALGYDDRRTNDIFHLKARSGQLVRVRAERVRQQQPRPRLHILPLYALHNVRRRDGKRLRAVAELQPRFLEHRPHRAVEQRNRFRICHRHSSVMSSRLANAQVWRAEHPSQPFGLRKTCVRLIPSTAVTDFRGIKIPLWLTVSPMDRPAFSTSQICPDCASGMSP